jgi:hypothetical protein
MSGMEKKRRDAILGDAFNRAGFAFEISVAL